MRRGRAWKKRARRTACVSLPLWARIPRVYIWNNELERAKDAICEWPLRLSFHTSRCIAPRKHYHVCICDRRKDKTTSTTLHRSKLAFESSEAETYLQAVSPKHQTVLAKLELPHFIETAFVQACKQGYSGSGNSPPWIAPHTLEYLRCIAGTVL